jgi:hypothetical protein
LKDQRTTYTVHSLLCEMQLLSTFESHTGLFDAYEQTKNRAFRSGRSLSRQQKVAQLTKHSRSEQEKATQHALSFDQSNVIESSPRGRAVIFIDWDDTLLPSSDLNRNGITIANVESLRKQDNPLAAMLDAYEEAFIEFVRRVKQAGDVYIVTNAVHVVLFSSVTSSKFTLK